MKNAHPHQKAEVSAPATGALIVTSAGKLPARTDTLRAEVLRRLLCGDTLTGLEAAFGASTTRLAAVVHALTEKYGWTIGRIGKAVGCNDGRIQTVTEYHLLPLTLSEAMRSGADAWCTEVCAARALRRTKAADAHRRAAAANAERSKPRALSFVADQAAPIQRVCGLAL